MCILIGFARACVIKTPVLSTFICRLRSVLSSSHLHRTRQCRLYSCPKHQYHHHSAAFFAFSSFLTYSYAKSNNYNLDHLDALYDANDFEGLKTELESLEDEIDPEILWRRARLLWELIKLSGKKTVTNTKEAYSLIEEALRQDENNSDVHRWAGRCYLLQLYLLQ